MGLIKNEKKNVIYETSAISELGLEIGRSPMQLRARYQSETK